MTVQDITTLKGYFETGDVPTQAQFVDLMDTLFSMAPKASPTFTGTPAAPTAAGGTNTTQLATTAFVQAAMAALINAAPGALDTLDELAAALGDDASFAATMTTALAGKQALHANLTALAGLSFVADRLIYGTGTGTIALATLTAAGRALLDDANAAAQLTTLGVSAFVQTLLDDANAAAVLTTLGVSAFVQTMLDDADAATVRATIGLAAASAAEILAGSDIIKPVTSGHLLSSLASVALSDGATITPDFAAGRNFHVTLGGNRTLANPSNQAAGQAGRVLIKQDGTGGRTLTYGGQWLFPGGTDPVLSTAINAVDMLCYDVQASGEVYATMLKAFS